MKKSVAFGFILVLILNLPVAAEFYRYQDEHGNTIYTDDYSKVPPDQREGVQSYEESISKPEAKSLEEPSEKIDPQNVSTEINNKTRQRLEKRQKALAKEFKTLSAEREALDKNKKEAVTNAQIKAYNKKTIEFNARIKAYEEKRDAHSIEVEKFNAKMANQESEIQSQE